MKALDQRARTIVKVVSEIVKRQQGFFERGVAAMKPMTLREIAEAIEMHESTISRVTSNKYVLCDRGLFELKYFFGSGVASTEGEGEGAAAEAVKAAIREIIDNEVDVLSDDAIAGLLKQRGFDCARRTVVKYREVDGDRLIDPAPPPAEDRRRRLGRRARRLGRQPRPDRQDGRKPAAPTGSCALRPRRSSAPCRR